LGRRPAPTKANLFKAQHELKFASEGCDLLHQKRDVLIMELMSVSADFKDEEQSLRKALMDAFDNFIPGYAASGQELMDRVFGT
jgi:V/A-type H+-transporting ATPase subunit D